MSAYTYSCKKSSPVLPYPCAVFDLDLDWVKSHDLSERLIVGPSNLFRLRNLPLSPPSQAIA